MIIQGKTWDDAVERWLVEKSDKKSLKSDKSNIRWLNKYLCGIPLADIDRDVISALKTQKIASGVSNATVNRMLALLRGVLRSAAFEWDWLPHSPSVKLLREPSRRIRYLSSTQAIRLLMELPSHLSVMAAFSLATGLRRSNVTGLEWSQIDLKRKVAWFEGDQMKSGNPQVIPLNPDALRILLTRLNIHPVFVFTYKGHRIIQTSTAAWYKALKRAGIVDFRWHDLRHTWASWHIQSGTPLFALQELGGWESSEMVRRYAHLSIEHLAAYASKLPDFICAR